MFAEPDVSRNRLEGNSSKTQEREKRARRRTDHRVLEGDIKEGLKTVLRTSWRQLFVAHFLL
jgi:hypothetical protein